MRELPEGGGNLPARPQYFDVPPAEVIEEPASGGLLEYWNILRRRKGTLVLIAFLGLLAALLLTLPQTPIYQARTTLEIQGLSENFLNMGDVNPTAPVGSYSPYQDIQTRWCWRGLAGWRRVRRCSGAERCGKFLGRRSWWM